jgi:hypothetical protein
MAPHGRFGAVGAGAAAGAGAGAGDFTAPCAGAVWRWVTLPDCLPMERPPPNLAASAVTLAKVKNISNIQDPNFMTSPNDPYR